MAAGFNNVQIIGNLGADPSLSYTDGGIARCGFSVAVNEPRKGGGEHTEWVHVVAWGNTAEACAQYLSKGRQVFVSGPLRQRKWETRDGEKRLSVEVHAQRVIFLQGGETSKPQDQAGGYSSPGGADDDIPF